MQSRLVSAPESYWRAPTAGLLAVLSLNAADATGADPAQVAPSPVPVKLSGHPKQGLRLEARHANWNQVFTAIRKQTGVEVHYTVLPQCDISMTCTGQNAQQLVECLLGKNISVIYRVGNGKRTVQPAEAWVMSNNTLTASAAKAPANGSPAACTPAQTVATTARSVKDSVSDGTPPPSPASVDGLLELVHSDDSNQRIQAIAALAAHAEADAAMVRAELDTALTDKEPEVRAQAVFGYARHDGQPPEQVLRTAMQDRDASVRMMAIDVANPENASGKALLNHALSDKDPSVRQYARMKLEAIKKNAAEQSGNKGT